MLILKYVDKVEVVLRLKELGKTSGKSQQTEYKNLPIYYKK